MLLRIYLINLLSPFQWHLVDFCLYNHFEQTRYE